MYRVLLKKENYIMRIYIKKVKNTKGEVKEWIWVDFYDNEGKRQRKSLKLPNTKANMRLAKNKIVPTLLYRLENNEFIEKSVPTLNEYKIKSFEMNKSHRRETTQNDYEISYKKHIAPYLGKKRLDKIKASDLELWQNKVIESVSPRRLKNIRAVLSGILNDAYRDELIDKNPLTLVRTIKADKVNIKPFSIDDISLILANSTGQIKNFFALAFFSGMRSGEMIGLKWCDVDLLRLEIKPQRSRKMGKDGKLKTESSYRVIEILDSLLPYLKNQYLLTGSKNTYVFLNENDEPLYDIKRVRNTHWKKTLKMCNLDYRPIYHTRHTFATIMLENGEDILWVSNMLGHTDSTMTLSKYARYTKRENKKRGQFLKTELTPIGTEIDTEFLKRA